MADYESLHKKTVLVVDDDRIVLRILERTLQAYGMVCLSCSDSQEALEMLKVASPDAMVVDWMLPAMDGVELAEHAKKLYPKMPCIIITGKEGVPPTDLPILKKPFNPSVLIERILEAA